MVSLPACTVEPTPEPAPWALSPVTGQAFDAGYDQLAFCTWLRYVVKLAVVPEPSERTTGVILSAGSVMPGLSLTRAGSFHVVIFLSKIFAMEAESRFSDV